MRSQVAKFGARSGSPQLHPAVNTRTDLAEWSRHFLLLCGGSGTAEERVGRTR